MVWEIERNQSLDYEVVSFLDDDRLYKPIPVKILEDRVERLLGLHKRAGARVGYK